MQKKLGACQYRIKLAGKTFTTTMLREPFQLKFAIGIYNKGGAFVASAFGFNFCASPGTHGPNSRGVLMASTGRSSKSQKRNKRKGKK